jgi:hypothetical protein
VSEIARFCCRFWNRKQSHEAGGHAGEAAETAEFTEPRAGSAIEHTHELADFNKVIEAILGRR